MRAGAIVEIRFSRDWLSGNNGNRYVLVRDYTLHDKFIGPGYLVEEISPKGDIICAFFVNDVREIKE